MTPEMIEAFRKIELAKFEEIKKRRKEDGDFLRFLNERRNRGAEAYNVWLNACMLAELKGLPKPPEPLESIMWYPESQRPISKP